MMKDTITMMKYSYVIIMLCIYSTVSLKAKESNLGDILQQVGQKKSLNKPVPKKKAKEKSRFIFKDNYEMNGIGSKDKNTFNNQKKSTSYEYKNKSKFKFKFAPGTDVSNIVTGQGSGSGASGGSGGGGARKGGGQGRGGGRR